MKLITALKNHSLPCYALALILGTASVAEAKTLLYRYRDDNGVVVLGNSVPPEYARKGYEIVDSFGRVVKEIPPALTPEQIAEQERLEAERARQEELARQQQEADRALLLLYSHPDDAIRARDRKLVELDALINLKQNTIESTQKKIVEQESKAADIERSGRKVPDQILDEIQRNVDQINTLESEIEAHKTTRAEVVSEFEEKIERLQFLINRR